MADGAVVPFTSQDILDVDGKTLVAMLLSTSVTADRTVVNADDLTAFETTGFANYDRVTLTSVAYDETTGIADAADATFVALGAPGDFVGGAAIIDATSGVDATSPVIALGVFDPERECDGGDFVITFGPDGIARHDVYDPDIPEAWVVGSGAGAWSDPVYRRDREAVTFRGTVTGGATGSTLDTLPAGYLPVVDEALTVRCEDAGDPTLFAFGTLAIDSGTGDMVLTGPLVDFPVVRLTGVTFPVA